MTHNETIASIKKGLLLLGSFIIAYNMEVFLHELCHATAAWISGGDVSGIVINPFSWSYSYSHSPYLLFHTAAGPLGSSLLGLLLFVILFRWTKTWLLPLLLIGPLSFIDSGEYLLVDTIMLSGGDACSLIEYGVPSFILIVSGLLLLIVGLILAFLLIKRIGLLDTNFKDRLITFTIGIIPYLLAMLIWNYFYNYLEIMLWLTYAVSGTLLTLFVAAIPIQSLMKTSKQPYSVSWKAVTVVNLIAIALIVFLLVGPFSEEHNYPYDIEFFQKKPEDFPIVLTPPSYAFNPTYGKTTSDSQEFFYLSYQLLTTIQPDEIRSFLTNLHNEQGYRLLTHSIYDPNRVHNNNWEEEIEKRYEVPYRIKSYDQNWLIIDSCIFKSKLLVSYVWKKEKLSTVSVLHTIVENTPVEIILTYVNMHPEQFDPNQIELIGNLSSNRNSQTLNER